jgi:glycosyltransferase involved in cell wall biosynthesis
MEIDKKNIEVSIVCMTYNQAGYVRTALEGFLMQKTNFDYEIVVHDDASTDNTRCIIDEYAEKYPSRIVKLYETENKYSKNALSMQTILSKCKGKYIAYCEGDDYWTDKHKLQFQFDFMEKNSDVSICFHNYIIVEADGNCRYTVMREGNFSVEQIFSGWRDGSLPIRTLTVMYRKEYMLCELPAYMKVTCKFGDVPLYFYMASVGKLYILPNVMSVYRHGAIGSYSNRVNSSDMDYVEDITFKNIVLTNLKKSLPSKYTDRIDEMIMETEYKIDLATKKYKAALNPKYRKYYKTENLLTKLYIVGHVIFE